MIFIKRPEEIEKMREAGKVTREALELAEKHVKAGITTLELNNIMEDYIISKGGIPSFKNYHGYPAAACISLNDIVVHGIPDSRKLEEGDIVSIDVGAIIKGYHGDAARTFAVGKISEERQRIIDVTKQSFFEGILNAKAGRRLGDISSKIQTYVERNGFSIVRAMVGHGIGKNMHEEPSVPNYGMANTGVLLKKGMALAIEPMVNAGKFEIKFDADGWTCRTIDGHDSAHYENTIVITDGEPEILTL